MGSVGSTFRTKLWLSLLTYKIVRRRNPGASPIKIKVSVVGRCFAGLKRERKPLWGDGDQGNRSCGISRIMALQKLLQALESVNPWQRYFTDVILHVTYLEMGWSSWITQLDPVWSLKSLGVKNFLGCAQREMRLWKTSQRDGSLKRIDALLLVLRCRGQCTETKKRS